MKDSDDAIITFTSTIVAEARAKEEESSIHIDEISELNFKVEQPVSEVDGIMQENNSKEKLLESDGSCLNDQLNEKDDNISSFKEDLGKNDESEKQIYDVDEALDEKEENDSTVKEGLGELGEARLQLNEALIQSCEKDEKVSSFEGVFVEKEENVLIMEQCTANNKAVSDFDGACLNEQLNMEPPQVDEEDNSVSSNNVVIVKNEKVSIREEVFREKEEVKVDNDVEVMCKTADENHVNFDEAHLNEQLNEELPQVDEEDNKASSHEVMAVEKEENVLIMERGSANNNEVSDFDGACLNKQLNVEPPQVDEEDNNVSSNEVLIVKNEKVSIMEEVWEKEVAKADKDVEILCKKTDEIHVNFDEASLNGQLNEELPQVDEEYNKASSHEVMAVEKEENVLIMEQGLANNNEVSDFDGACLNEQLNVEPPQVDKEDNNISSNEVVIVEYEKISTMDKVFREEEEAKANMDVEVMCKKADENHVNFDEAHLNEQLSEELPQVNEEDNKASLYEVVAVEKEKVSILVEGVGKNEKETVDIANVIHKQADEKHLHCDGAHINEHSNEESPEVDEKILASQETLVPNVPSLDKRVGGESIYESDEVMHDSVQENKSDVSMSKFTESLNAEDVKLSTLQDELATEQEKATSFKDEDGQKISAHEPSAPNLDVNAVKEQSIEELNTQNENFNLLKEPLVVRDENCVPLNHALVVKNIHTEGLAAKRESNLSIEEGFDKTEIAKEDNDKNILQQEITPDKAEDSADKQDEVEEMDIDEGGPATSVGKRSTMKRKSGQSKQSQNKRTRVRQKLKEDESLCFICFDGGDLVVCDHRRCPKVYHPLCVNREEEYFKAKGLWICGWHICNSCEKNAHYMCYTCTYSMCKGCFKSSEFACVRGSKGFCKGCIETVVMIEMKKASGQTKDMGELDELFLFRDYWLELNEKLSLTKEELTRASNQLKEPNLASTDKEETLNKIKAGKRKVGLSEDNPDNANEEKPRSSSRRLKQNKETTSSAIKKLKSRLRKPKNVSISSEWASKELLDFVAHMKDGDRSEISQFDVQGLLLAYIKQHNLRDPHKKSQIICDSMLLNLFGKSRVGHLEMLKLLEPHFLIKETSPLATDENQGGVVDPDPNRMDSEESNDAFSKTTSDKRRKSHKNSGEKSPAHNGETYAAVDVHNVSKMYLRRNLIENLLDDADTFHEKVVGAFVRIRITGSASNKDMYRLVQIVGTGKAANMYNTGRRTTDITLEILNLNKREFLTIDLISNQEFTKEECKRLRQSVRCGLIDRMTVAQAQEKANVLHAVKVNDSLESEKLRLSNLRDLASEQGRKKDHRISVEKLQILSTPEVLSRRLNELPEIHIDPNMDLDNVSSDSEQDQNVRSQDNRKASTVTFRDVSKKLSLPKSEGNDARHINSPITPKSDTKPLYKTMSAVNSAIPIEDPVQSSNTAPQSSAQKPSSNVTTPNLKENEKMWHYVDPSGKIQGPFSMTQLRKWNANKFFPINLRIWRTSEKQEDSILLTDALDGKFNNASQPGNMATLVDPRVSNLSANNSSSTRQPLLHGNNNSGPTTHITHASQPTNMKPLVDSKASNFSATSSPTKQSQLHSNHNSGPNSRNPEKSSRWNADQNRQNNWNPDRTNIRFQSNNNNNNNNRGNDRQNFQQSSRNQQFSTQQMNPQPSNVPMNRSQAPHQGNNIDWAGLQGAINNILPSTNLNQVEHSSNTNTTNVDLQPSNDQNVSLNPSCTQTVPDASAQQQQIATNTNMTYPAVPNAANMHWGMVPQAPVNMNMNWGGAANMNMAWAPPAQQMANPNMNVGWVMPAQGMPMQVNPGWVAPVADPNAGWVAPQAVGINANQAANSQVHPNNATNQMAGAVVGATNPAPVGLCNFFMNGHCKKGTSCNYMHS